MLSCRPRLCCTMFWHNPQRWLAACLYFSFIEAGRVTLDFRLAAKRFWANMCNIIMCKSQEQKTSVARIAREDVGRWPKFEAFGWIVVVPIDVFAPSKQTKHCCSNETWNSHLRGRTLKHGWLLARCLVCHLTDGRLDQDRFISSGGFITPWQ